MRRRRLKKLWHRLQELQSQKISRDTLLLKIGAAKKEAGRVYALVDVALPKPREPVNPETFTIRLRKEKLREMRRREGCYLLRSNLTQQDPAYLWDYYTQLTEVEQAFKELKGDLARPIYHQTDNRIEAHIFVAFWPTAPGHLKFQAKQQAPGLTPIHPGKLAPCRWSMSTCPLPMAAGLFSPVIPNPIGIKNYCFTN
jgi:hypothetical protein